MKHHLSGFQHGPFDWNNVRATLLHLPSQPQDYEDGFANIEPQQQPSKNNQYPSNGKALGELRDRTRHTGMMELAGRMQKRIVQAVKYPKKVPKKTHKLLHPLKPSRAQLHVAGPKPMINELSKTVRNSASPKVLGKTTATSKVLKKAATSKAVGKTATFKALRKTTAPKVLRSKLNNQAAKRTIQKMTTKVVATPKSAAAVARKASMATRQRSLPILRRFLGRGLLISLPFIGVVFALIACYTDYDRAQQEKERQGSSLLCWYACLLFLAAALADALDAVCQLIFCSSILLQHQTPPWGVEYTSMGCTVVSTVGAVVGELVSDRANNGEGNDNDYL